MAHTLHIAENVMVFNWLLLHIIKLSMLFGFLYLINARIDWGLIAFFLVFYVFGNWIFPRDNRFDKWVIRKKDALCVFLAHLVGRPNKH